MLTWLESAACQDLDTELFFPISPKGPGQRQADEAKAVCKTCPVQRQCATWALATAQEYGIWGGMDEEELVSARRRKRLGTGKRPSSRTDA
jgi:WhiB family redox-sensing transcriptional regulator